jgi:hypothetical protein
MQPFIIQQQRYHILCDGTGISTKYMVSINIYVHFQFLFGSTDAVLQIYMQQTLLSLLCPLACMNLTDIFATLIFMNFGLEEYFYNLLTKLN